MVVVVVVMGVVVGSSVGVGVVGGSSVVVAFAVVDES